VNAGALRRRADVPPDLRDRPLAVVRPFERRAESSVDAGGAPRHCDKRVGADAAPALQLCADRAL
jgi:hypothetical protein